MRNNSKIIFGVIATVLVLAMLLIYIFLAPEEGVITLEGVDNHEERNESVSSATKETFLPLETNVTMPTETYPVYELEQNVVIYKVEKDPNEVIEYDFVIDKSHPEYIDSFGGDMYFSEEGKVYRNDRTITYQLMDTHRNAYHEITFGYITGACNRFLYLNPVLTTNGERVPAYFHFFYGEGGESVFMIDDEKAKEPSYFFCRTLDVKRCAAYTGPKTPGAVWFAQNATEGPSYVDVLVIAEDGDYIASLRIWICKEEDGTYVFADIDDNNIVLTGTTSDCAFSDEEKKRLETLANSVANDIEQTHIGKISPAEDYTLDDMIIEWRAQSQSLYFYEFAPKEGVQKNTGYYVDIGMPILAVTVRGYNGSMSLTLYFQVLQYPSDTKAGTYHYIGRDYYNYSSAVVLHQQTAPGALEE